MNTTPKLIASIWFATSVALGLAGCGMVHDDEPGSCTLDAPGETFTFRVVNTGTRELFLPFGCGKRVPIVLDTPHGMLGLGIGNASMCQTSCERVYGGTAGTACSDCGNGTGVDLEPGATVTIDWDRRVYMKHVAPTACSGSEYGNECALGVALDPGAVTTGKLEVCPVGEYSQPGGYCYDPDLVPVTVDLTTDELTIEVE